MVSPNVVSTRVVSSSVVYLRVVSSGVVGRLLAGAVDRFSIPPLVVVNLVMFVPETIIRNI